MTARDWQHDSDGRRDGRHVWMVYDGNEPDEAGPFARGIRTEPEAQRLVDALELLDAVEAAMAPGYGLLAEAATMLAVHYRKEATSLARVIGRWEGPDIERLSDAATKLDRLAAFLGRAL